MSQPLLDRSAIIGRQSAVAELLADEAAWIRSVKGVIHQLPDLERGVRSHWSLQAVLNGLRAFCVCVPRCSGLSRIQNRKCKPLEFVKILQAFEKYYLAPPVNAD